MWHVSGGRNICTVLFLMQNIFFQVWDCDHGWWESVLEIFLLFLSTLPSSEFWQMPKQRHCGWYGFCETNVKRFWVNWNNTKEHFIQIFQHCPALFLLLFFLVFFGGGDLLFILQLFCFLHLHINPQIYNRNSWQNSRKYFKNVLLTFHRFIGNVKGDKSVQSNIIFKIKFK